MNYALKQKNGLLNDHMPSLDNGNDIQSECKVQEVSKTGRFLRFSLEVACRRPLLQHGPSHMAQGSPNNSNELKGICGKNLR